LDPLATFLYLLPCVNYIDHAYGSENREKYGEEHLHSDESGRTNIAGRKQAEKLTSRSGPKTRRSLPHAPLLHFRRVLGPFPARERAFCEGSGFTTFI
jgi:hypothetical protein